MIFAPGTRLAMSRRHCYDFVMPVPRFHQMAFAVFCLAGALPLIRSPRSPAGRIRAVLRPESPPGMLRRWPSRSGQVYSIPVTGDDPLDTFHNELRVLQAVPAGVLR